MNKDQDTNKLKAWISAMRLRTLPLSFSVIIMGSAFAWLEPMTLNFPRTYAYEFSWTIFVLTLVTTLFLQILSNLANDYGDAVKGTDNENRIGPERAIQSGAISAPEMKKGIIVSALLALVSGLFLLYVAFKEILDLQFLIFLILGLLSIAAAIKYTVGKGAYGYRALGDLFVFIFFGLVGVMGSYYLQAHAHFEWMIIFPATIMGLFCVMVLNLNNMRDRENDTAVGKRTVAVLLGFKGAKIYHYSLMFFAWIGPLYLFTDVRAYPAILVWLPVIIIHTIHLIKVIQTKNPKDFDPQLKVVALSSFLFALGTWIIIALIK